MSDLTQNQMLVLAAAAGDLDFVIGLVSDGADINAIIGQPHSETHLSPLAAAANSGKLHVVRWLLENGARTGVNNDDDENAGQIDPVTTALLHGHDDVADLIYSFGGRPKLLIGLCVADRFAAVCEILSREPIRWQEYALDAVRSGNERMVRHCLQVRPETYEGNLPTILNSCIFQWRLTHHYRTKGFDRTAYQRILRMLLDHGFEADARTQTGATPLHSAARAGVLRPWSPLESECVAFTEILLTHGANVNAVDGQGRTPLSYAMENKRSHVIAVLERHGGHD